MGLLGGILCLAQGHYNRGNTWACQIVLELLFTQPKQTKKNVFVKVIQQLICHKKTGEWTDVSPVNTAPSIACCGALLPSTETAGKNEEVMKSEIQKEIRL